MLSPTLGEAQRPSPAAATSAAPTRFLTLLDSRFYIGDLAAFATRIVNRAAAHHPGIAVGVNAHLVNQVARDQDFAADLRDAAILYADGQSVVWAARALDLPVAERIATTDLAPLVVEKAAISGLRIYLLGGEPGVAALAADELVKAHPRAQIRAHHGFLSTAADDHEVLQDISDWGTELLFIGMGDPKQLRWAVEHRAALGSAVVLTSGGLFDWLSGRNARAPQWMIKAGFEWLWRLFIEPKRLWRRYVIGNPEFMIRVVRSSITHRRRTARLAGARQVVRAQQLAAVPLMPTERTEG